MAESGELLGPPGSFDALVLEAGGVRIARGELHLGSGHPAIPLTDVVSADETTPAKTTTQILTLILGCAVLLVAVPSAMMCPLALMGIPLGGRILSKVLEEQERSFALRVTVRGRAPIVVKFDERRHGLHIAQALDRVVRG
jgi:hypothetical protein